MMRIRYDRRWTYEETHPCRFWPTPSLPRHSGGDHPRGTTILHDQVVASDLQPPLFRLIVETNISRIKHFLRKITAFHLNLL